MNRSTKRKIKLFLEKYKEGKRTKANLINGLKIQKTFWEVYYPTEPLPDSITAGLVILRVLKDKPNRWREPENETWKKGVFENESDIEEI